MVKYEEVVEAAAVAALPVAPDATSSPDPVPAATETEATSAALAVEEKGDEVAPEPGEPIPIPGELKKVEEAHMRELIVTAEDEISGMKQENLELQRRVWTMQKKRGSINAEQFILEGQEACYRTRLNNWSETKEEFERLKDEYDNKIDSLRERLQNKENESRNRHEGMIQYIWQERLIRIRILGLKTLPMVVARESADSISGKKISESKLFELEQKERETIVKMQAVRIRGRQLRNQLQKLKHTLELKDQLPGGLYLVDFEQLEMENESLNEKIHSKNEALSSLRKKTNNLAHTLTHAREKLQFIVQETKMNGEALAADDKTLHEGRIKLCEIKAACEGIKHKKENLQKNVVNITAPVLLDDMEFQREDIESATETFQELKTRYHDLKDTIQKDEKKLFTLGKLQATSWSGSSKSRPSSPPIEHDPLRWGTKRKVLGQLVVSPWSPRSESPSR